MVVFKISTKDSSDQCPYGAMNCPKVDELNKSLREVCTSLEALTKIVYVLAGIIMIQFGVQIW